MESRRFTVINEAFRCRFCHSDVVPLRTGCRNHCPHCLHSIHVDAFPGDRAAGCGGLMIPFRVFVHSKKGYMIEHRCQLCGTMTVNKLALEDPVQPDDMDTVLAIMKGMATGRQP
ncbi:MAG: RNHCP domain-containing protein [Bacilli bacterium]